MFPLTNEIENLKLEGTPFLHIKTANWYNPIHREPGVPDIREQTEKFLKNTRECGNNMIELITIPNSVHYTQCDAIMLIPLECWVIEYRRCKFSSLPKK